MIKVDKIRVFNFEGAFRGLRNPLESHDKADSFFGIAEDWEEMYELAYEVANSYITNDWWQPGDDELFDERREWLIQQGTRYVLSSEHATEVNYLGREDLNLGRRMVLAGTDEGKFARQIFISMDITAPLHWWKEFDTYKIGTVANSESTMHRITKEPITRQKFGFDDPTIFENYPPDLKEEDIDKIIERCEWLRRRYLDCIEITKNKDISEETRQLYGEYAKHYWRRLIKELPDAWLQKRTVTLNYQVGRAMYFARRFHKQLEWREFCDIILTLPYADDLISCEKE